MVISMCFVIECTVMELTCNPCGMESVSGTREIAYVHHILSTLQPCTQCSELFAHPEVGGW